MVYLSNQKNQTETNRCIVNYINNNPDKKFIVVMSESRHTKSLLNRINRSCTRIGTKIDDYGNISTYNVNKAVLNKSDVILLSFNYLPLFYKKMKEIAKEYTLIVDNKFSILSYYKLHGLKGGRHGHRGNYIPGKSETQDGITYFKTNQTGCYLETIMSSNNCMVIEGKSIKVMSYPKSVIESFENCYFCSSTSYEELEEYFDRFKIEYELLK